MKRKYFLGVVAFGLAFFLQTQAALATECNNGYTCQSTCTTANTLTGLFSNCLGNEVCCRTTAISITPGACLGNSTNNAGTCKQTCVTNEIKDGVCTEANGGATYKDKNCCVASIATTEGTCNGTSTKTNGTCKDSGTCGTAEKADGTCTVLSGAANVNKDCCVASSASNSGSTKFTNPLIYNNLVEIVTHIMVLIQSTIVLFALVAITIGALIYVLSTGNETMITRAKDIIGAALLGLAIAIAAPSILKELTGALGWTGATDASLAAAPSLSAITVKILNFLLGIFGILSLIMMIIGAGLYLTSAGDEDRIDKGKDIFKYALIGVIIAMSAMVLIKQIASLLVA